MGTIFDVQGLIAGLAPPSPASAPPAAEAAPLELWADVGAVLRVFDHWVYMLNRHPHRTALGPKRRALIERALSMYPEDTVLMAVEGCAASAWHAGANDRHRAFQDIELILRDEAHIERFADDGERLRERVQRLAAREVQEAMARAALTPDVAAASAEIAATARERLRRIAAELRRGGA